MFLRHCPEHGPERRVVGKAIFLVFALGYLRHIQPHQKLYLDDIKKTVSRFTFFFGRILPAIYGTIQYG